jgi:hypothetical protein
MQSTRLPPMAAMSLAAKRSACCISTLRPRITGTIPALAAGSRAARPTWTRCKPRSHSRRSSHAPISAQFKSWAALKERPSSTRTRILFADCARHSVGRAPPTSRQLKRKKTLPNQTQKQTPPSIDGICVYPQIALKRFPDTSPTENHAGEKPARPCRDLR